MSKGRENSALVLLFMILMPYYMPDRYCSDLESAIFPSMRELGELTGTDKVIHHGYHRFYEKWFGGIRGKDLKLLEIGLARGSSMNMWCGYFPGAEIYGIDITLDERCQPCKLGQGIFVFSGDRWEHASREGTI